MSQSSGNAPGATVTDRLEETFIAIILGAMTVLTFVNVIFRYTFDWGIVNWLEATLNFTWPDSIPWGYETTLILFSWLVLFGMSYCVKKTAHLGVDAVINVLSAPSRRILALVAGACCILYTYLLIKGSWDYFAPFVNLPGTTGHWFPTGLEEMSFRNRRAFYTFDEIGMPAFLSWLGPVFGEEFEKLPRFVGYMILPIGTVLLMVRFIQATRRVWMEKADRIIAAHEVEDDLETLKKEH